MAVDLSIILLVWNDRAYLPACLESVARTQNISLEIILIENGITLEASEYALPQSAHPIPIVKIHNAENRGVAPARNQGLETACGRYLLLLDVDTVVTQGALVQLVRFMDANSQVGLAGPRLQDADGNLQLTCRKLPTVWSKFLRRIPGRWAQDALADEMLTAYDHRVPRAVDYVIGACQIVRRAAYETVGAFDAQFFYGPEDVDYCMRMWRHGWRVMYVPQAVVTHTEQRVTKQRAFSKLALVHVWGLARFFWKHRSLFARPRLDTVAGAADVPLARS